MTNNPLQQTTPVKTCEYGHHYYTGVTCPLCDYLGRDNLEHATQHNNPSQHNNLR